MAPLTGRRRTGVTLDQRPLDVNGIEEISGIFSSPRKSSPLKNVMVLESVEEAGMFPESVEMSGPNNTCGKPSERRTYCYTTYLHRTIHLPGCIISDNCAVITPIQTLSARRSARNTPARPPRSSSPKKSGISGAARKSNGVDIFSAPKSLQNEDFEDRENTPVLVPTPVPNAANSQAGSIRTVQRTQPRRFSPTPEKSPLRDITTITPTRMHRSRPSLDLQRPEDEVAPSIEDEDSDPYQEAVNEVEAAVHANAEVLPSSEPAAVPTPTPRNRIASEELGDDITRFDDEEIEQDHESGPSVPPMPQNKANSRKKRKSDAVEQDGDLGSPKPNKVPKKRGRPRLHRDSPPLAPSPQTLSTKAKGKQPLRKKDMNLKLSSRQEKELEDIVEKVRARPCPPRSLYILRRETPADESVTHTKSGRVSVRPLAYWRNERCVYGTSPGGAALADGARFPLNSIQEIVRTEDIVEHVGKKKSSGKNKGKSRKHKGNARQTSVEEADASDSDFDLDETPKDPDAEPWETESGTLRGNVSMWDNQEQAPTEQEEEVELAHAPAAIKTREVKGSSLHDGPTFRYAKLLSTQFFGTGLVDVPPGGIKRPKNSRKMHMSFFVVKGRVTVVVGPIGGEETGNINRFSIGKGGFWQVPRGEFSKNPTCSTFAES